MCTATKFSGAGRNLLKQKKSLVDFSLRGVGGLVSPPEHTPACVMCLCLASLTILSLFSAVIFSVYSAFFSSCSVRHSVCVP